MRKSSPLLLAIGAVLIGTVAGLISLRDTSASRVAARSHEVAPVSPKETTIEKSFPRVADAPSPNFSVRFVPAPPSVQNDPRAKDYDAVKLRDVTGASIRQIFLREPRHPDFAPFVEKRLNHYFEHDLKASGVGGRILGADCHSRICEVTIEADSPDEMKKVARVLQMTPMSSVFQVGPEVAPNTRVFTFAWEGGESKAAAWILGYEDMRRQALEVRRKISASLPAAEIPFSVPPDIDPPKNE